MAELEQKNKYIAIMDDLLLNSTKAAHWKLLEQLFQSMCKNGLKLSPKNCQLFRTKLTYMGNEFVISKRTMTITPLRSRTETISKIQTPKTAKQCKSFCGVVNYLSLFCPDLQTLLKPIVELTRKSRPFVWGQEQERAFKEVKSRLTPLCYTCLRQRADLFCILIQVLRAQGVHCDKYKKEKLD